MTGQCRSRAAPIPHNGWLSIPSAFLTIDVFEAPSIHMYIIRSSFFASNLGKDNSKVTHRLGEHMHNSGGAGGFYCVNRHRDSNGGWD